MMSKRIPNSLKFIATSVSLLVMTCSAFGENAFKRNENTCFKRTYSAEHLSQHPQQTVTFIQVKHSIDENKKLIAGYGDSSNASKETLIGVSVRFKGDPKTYSNILVCPDDRKLCGVECDGGQAEFKRNADGDLLLDVRKTGGFVLEGGCDAGETVKPRSLGNAADDKLFKLYSTKMSLCRF